MLYPDMNFCKDSIKPDSTTYLGGEGQLQAVQVVAFLAREDKRYLPLMHKLTDALITYGINADNNLTWYQVNTIETMYGLFIGTLLEAEQVLDQPKGILYQRSVEHANNIFVSGFGLKNDMVPHQLNGQTGGYWGSNSDFQLNYAVIQFPFGMELLSQEAGNSIHRLTSNRVINAFLNHSKVGDNVNEPQGYVDITETQPPYGFELDYGVPKYMSQIFYLPTYILFNSIHPSTGVTIDWQNGLPIGVLGLASNMPFFDRNLVNVDVNNKTIHFSKVTGAVIVDLGNMGFGTIKRVIVDGHDSGLFTETKITTLNGTHSYQVYWN